MNEILDIRPAIKSLGLSYEAAREGDEANAAVWKWQDGRRSLCLGHGRTVDEALADAFARFQAQRKQTSAR